VTFVVLVLLAGAAFLGRSWLAERATTAQLRSEIAVLKRRIAARRED
jgi:hypothetical protein